jgi:spermidine/putrescine transport system ATP-binding protein
VLRLVAGFEIPDAGAIRVEGEDVTQTAPERRRFGMVFQHYALFPHMTVGENVAFGLGGRKAGRDRASARERVAETLAIVDLAGFEDRRVTELSGGQQQRVAVARALAPSPRVLLLDEPLSNLDPTLRERTRRELKSVIRRTGITTLFVTHEQEEAFDLGDRVAVLSSGRIEQVGTPESLYEEPATRFVAGFIGRSSSLRATWRDGNGRGHVEFPGGVSWPAHAAETLAPGESVEVLVRPEAMVLAAPGSPQSLAGTVAERRYAGSAAFYSVGIEGVGEAEVLGGSRDAAPGDAVAVAPAAGGPPPRAYAAERPK